MPPRRVKPYTVWRRAKTRNAKTEWTKVDGTKYATQTIAEEAARRHTTATETVTRVRDDYRNVFLVEFTHWRVYSIPVACRVDRKEIGAA